MIMDNVKPEIYTFSLRRYFKYTIANYLVIWISISALLAGITQIYQKLSGNGLCVSNYFLTVCVESLFVLFTIILYWLNRVRTHRQSELIIAPQYIQYFSVIIDGYNSDVYEKESILYEFSKVTNCQTSRGKVIAFGQGKITIDSIFKFEEADVESVHIPPFFADANEIIKITLKKNC